jgi:tetratricopeptide (TPR) repeat protein
MTRRDRILRAGVAALVLLHLVAALWAPGALWSVSQLAVWPLAAAIAWTLVALAAVFVLPRVAPGRRTVAFPGHRIRILLALASILPFALARERAHFFGDGALLIRDAAWSTTVTHAPLLVRLTTAWVDVGRRLHISTETALAALSILAGVIAVYALLRLAATLTDDNGGRWLAAVLLLGAGAMQLFFGHIEYYALPAAGIAVYLAVACRRLVDGRSTWPTWPIFATLLPLHLQTVALAPAQLLLGWHDLRRGHKRPLALAVAGAAVLAPLLARLAGGSGQGLVRTAFDGFERYMTPFFDTTTSKHAFGFLSPSHWLAVGNDLMLSAPAAFVALPAIVALRLMRRDTIQMFLAVAALGGLLLSLLFLRELGPYRDWDILAPNAFVVLALIAACLVRPHPGAQRTAAVLFAVASLHHLAPWVLMQTSPVRTLAHLQLVLGTPSQWSPHAAAYLWEEIAIYHRTQKDEEASFAAYSNAVRANPADARYRIGLGNRLMSRGDMAGAEREFRAALATRPNFGPAHHNLAVVLLRTKRDLPEALEHARAAVQAEPSSAEFWVTLAGAEMLTGDRDAALGAVDKALHLRPNLESAARMRARLQASASP